jgi:thiamine-phosphate pyrophosphorylase
VASDANPIICYVTDSATLPGGVPALGEAIKRAIALGANWVQLRERELPARELLVLAREAVRRARGAGVKIIVNDRLDVASAAGAGGVHLGGHSIPVSEVAKWRRRSGTANLVIGASCHSLEEARAAERDGADYVFFGPVFETPSKMAYGPPQGLERLAEVAAACRIPVVAIGGITRQNALECMKRGAGGYAGIRLFQD